MPVPCAICSTPTEMTHTKRCDRCYNLERALDSDPVGCSLLIEHLLLTHPGFNLKLNLYVPNVLVNVSVNNGCTTIELGRE
jgi:hypothetical protein